jgi:hypothetical protein
MVEFSRSIDVEKLVKTKKGEVDISANPSECEALEKRFGFLKVTNLSLQGTIVHRTGTPTFRFKGVLKALITQSCVQTEKPVDEIIEEPIEILLSRHVNDDNEDEILEDIEQMEGGFVDFGEVAAQYLSLSADPYPLCKEF